MILSCQNLTFIKHGCNHFLSFAVVALPRLPKGFPMKKSYTILYVDDDIDDLFLISDAFEKYTDHLRVVHAGNGSEGLKTLATMKEHSGLPCLVIIDINMPIMDGKQMLEKLRKYPEYKELPVIVFSTSNSQTDEEFAKSLDADFISKPTQYGELKMLVEEFVSKCRFDVSRPV